MTMTERQQIRLVVPTPTVQCRVGPLSAFMPLDDEMVAIEVIGPSEDVIGMLTTMLEAAQEQHQAA